MVTNDNLINWFCATCGALINKPVFFFLAAACHCPHYNAALNMKAFRLVQEAYEKDVRDQAA